jgi:hypothetical protein
VSLALSGDTIAYMMGLGLSAEQMKGLVDRLQRDATAMAPPATSNGINEERERLRNESTYAERKRAKDRERQRRLREQARQSRDVASDPRDNRATSTATEGDANRDVAATGPSRTGAQVVTPSLPSLRSEEVVVVVGERERAAQSDDWPEGDASDHAKLLVEAAGSPWLDPNKALGLVTSTGLIATWRREGASWNHDVKPVVIGMMAKQRKRVNSWLFFRDAIAQQVADNRAALEIPEARVVPLRPGGESFADRAAADIAEARRRLLEG